MLKTAIIAIRQHALYIFTRKPQQYSSAGNCACTTMDTANMVRVNNIIFLLPLTLPH
jgi:hypothetical protein